MGVTLAVKKAGGAKTAPKRDTSAGTMTEASLFKCLKIKPQKSNEDRQAYLKRLQVAVAALQDNDWDTLNAAAQDWANAAAAAINNDKDVPDFDTDQPKEAESESDTDAEEETEEEPKTKGKNKSADNKSAKGEAEKAPKKAKNGPPSMRRFLKQLVAKKPKTSIEDLTAKLKDAGHSPADTSVKSIRSDTLDTMRVLVDLKILDVELP